MGISDTISRLVIGAVELDVPQLIAVREGKRIKLLPTECRLLEYLMRNAGRIVTRAMLLTNVWDLQFDPRTNNLESHISRLRGKLNDSFSTDAIRTVRGTGYQFVGHQRTACRSRESMVGVHASIEST